jgi:hypothetical protein
VKDPDELLEFWRDSFDFSKHRIFRAHVPARDGLTLLKSTAEKLRSEQIRFAFTGLSGAWLWTPFATFRLVTIYLSGILPDRALNVIGGRKEEQGGNLWLVTPNDEGVFHGQEVVEGFPTVSSVQVYLDLKDHPERSEETAAELKRGALLWSRSQG